MKDIKVVCASTGIDPVERKLGVESYGAKDSSLEIENGILEITAYNAVENMEIPFLTEADVAKISENANRRVTQGALERRSTRNVQRELR